MSRKNKTVLGVIVAFAAIMVAVIYLRSVDIPVLQPAGPIGRKEKHLMVLAVLLSLVVVIPVFVMLIGFAWRYRESNKKARYSPNLDGSRLLEAVWWGVPIILISILAVVTWRSSHDLDPFKSLSSSKPPLTIQVVALQWKWLFIYPTEGVASVNYLKIPVNTPVDFQITSDAPMNSFWIPQLGGQIYAMSGMVTQLHLEASKTGNYYGESANISGEGFADMHFITGATSSREYKDWISSLRKSPDRLSMDTYDHLAEPHRDSSVRHYSSTQAGLFDQVVSKYEAPIYLTPISEAL